MADVLTLDQKHSLYQDGYVVVTDAVPEALVDAALARMKQARKGENLGSTAVMTDLLNTSSITSAR